MVEIGERGSNDEVLESNDEVGRWRKLGNVPGEWQAICRRSGPELCGREDNRGAVLQGLVAGYLRWAESGQLTLCEALLAASAIQLTAGISQEAPALLLALTAADMFLLLGSRRRILSV